MENTENLILEIARKHFIQYGFAGTRMQKIADEAGLNKAMVHYYFRSKNLLYRRIVQQTLNGVVGDVAQAFATEVPFWEKVELIVDTYFRLLLEHPEVPVFIMSELAQERTHFIGELKKRTRSLPGVQSFVMQIMQEMQSGQIRSMDPKQLLLNIMGMTVFPFMAKPVFCTLFEYSDQAFNDMMRERKAVIMQFLKQALEPG